MNRALLKHYAQAYFSLGKEKNKVDVFSKDMDFLFDVFQKSPDLIKFLSSPMINKIEKDTLLNNQIKPYIDVATLGFIQVLIRKKAIAYFDEIKIAFDHFYHEDQGILEGRLYTPFELSKETLNKIEQIFSNKYKKKVVFKTLIDKNVIAGMRIYVDDTLYDYSLDNKLNQVRNKLIIED